MQRPVWLAAGGTEYVRSLVTRGGYVNALYARPPILDVAARLPDTQQAGRRLSNGIPEVLCVCALGNARSMSWRRNLPRGHTQGWPLAKHSCSLPSRLAEMDAPGLVAGVPDRYCMTARCARHDGLGKVEQVGPGTQPPGLIDPSGTDSCDLRGESSRGKENVMQGPLVIEPRYGSGAQRFRANRNGPSGIRYLLLIKGMTAILLSLALLSVLG